MAVVNYKCDTCNREIKIIRNIQGLEIFGRCIITDSCKGYLKQIQILPSFINGDLPKDLEGLNNWNQTKKLYTHQQPFKRKEWSIKHYLGTEPSIQSFVYINDILTEISPVSTVTIDKNTTKLIFDISYKGVAQCIARSTNIPSILTKEEVSVKEEIFKQTSINNTIIFASLDNVLSSNVRIYWKNSQAISLGFVDQIIEPNSTILPWGDYTKILYKGKQYTIFNIDIIPPMGVDPGSTFYFDTDGGLFQTTNSLILFTNSPFFKNDIEKTKIFHMNNIDSASTQLYTLYNNNEMFIGESKIKSIYPSLKII